MIFVFDTSSSRSALALLDPSGAVIREEVHESGRTFDLPARFRALAGRRRLTSVAVATGPGSFTGLRVGVSFALGLAIGLEIPIVPLSTLGIQSARAHEPVLAVAEAGRGRVYFQAPGGDPGLAEPSDLPKELELVGWLRQATQAALVATGLRFRPSEELLSFGVAAGRLLETARAVPYGSLKLEYMQSFLASK